MRLILEASLYEIVLFELELAFSSDSPLVQLLSCIFVFRVCLKVRLEVVPVHLLLLCEATEEVGVVFGQSLALTFEHASLTTLVIVRVCELASMELLNLVECAVELFNGLLDVVPSFIEILTVWSWEENSLRCKLSVNFSKRFMHGIELLMSLLKSLELVSGVNQDAVCFICVHMDVNIGGRDSLDSWTRTVEEGVYKRDGCIFFSHIEMREG